MRPLAAIPDQNHESLVRLLEILAPKEGDLVALIEAYFDESYYEEGPRVLSLAGYLFSAEECRKLDLAWKAVLDRFDLPFFHMVDCAHGNYPFDKLTNDERIEAEKLMIGLIRKHMLFGSVMSVNEAEFNTWYVRQHLSAYSYCCWQELDSMRGWMEENNFDGSVAYIFEAGHPFQSEANGIMNQIFSDPVLKKSYRYGTHAFVPKATCRPVQAPDILAWLHTQTVKRGLRGIHEPRKDLVALVDDGVEHKVLILSSDNIDPLLALGVSADRVPLSPGISGTWGKWRFHWPF